jgi:signal transduction histidine kinase/ActR/RegA family two-component response regulator/sensor domain CHASE-containing protein
MHIFKTIYGKITAYLFLLGVIFLILFFFLFRYKSKSEQQVIDTAQKQFKREVTYLFELSSSPMIQTTYDYSYWDDFVSAISKNDTLWIKTNITLTNSFSYEYICVYDSNFKIISDLSKDQGSIERFIHTDTLKKIAGLNKTHFFSNSPSGLMEVTFTSIHPTNDPKHNKTTASGYLVVGRKLDLAYLNKMTEVFGAKVGMNMTKSDSNKEDKSIATYIPLHNWDGKYVSCLTFHRKLNHNFEATSILIHLILFSIMSILILTLFLARKDIDKPLKITTDILETENEESIQLLKQYQNEFGRIGKLFERFVIQKVELRAAKEKSQESDRLKSAFLANMSHEIRTPMNGILGFAELLKQKNLSGQEQQKYLEIIESSGARMLNIVNNIVDISKIESGIIEINNKVTNINEQIEFLTSFFAPEIEKKGLRLVCSKTFTTDKAYIETDAEKLYGILTNLLKNAIKHTYKGAIEIGYHLKSDDNQNFLEFFVTDSGDGIPEDKQNVIFDRFMQADMSNKTAYQGAGLGLSISKAYVEILGGTIWVESEHGVGSTFRFTIPYHPAEAEIVTEEKILPATKEKSINKLKILIVEDDPGMEFLLSETVEEYCSKLLIARDGMEALEIAKDNADIDLILMDIRIPKLDGYETTEEIRQFNKDVVIIAQTACAFSSDRDKALEVGCNDYVSKPIDTDLFESLMEKHFVMHPILL